MKISELKQPYKRMAEYCNRWNTNKCYDNKELLVSAFNWSETDDKFWYEVNKGSCPIINEEIKSYFPNNFNFSGEEENPFKLTEISVTDLKPIDENLQKRIYTQLAKEGRFDELPDTCEFSEPVEVEVWEDDILEPTITTILGKFKGKYVSKNFLCWKNAQLLPPKIDFSEFENGDVVEVETKKYGVYCGLIYIIDNKFIKLSFNKLGSTTALIYKESIKSIKKLK